MSCELRVRICKRLRSQPIKPGGPVRQIGLSYRAARLHRLAESIPGLLISLRIRDLLFSTMRCKCGWFLLQTAEENSHGKWGFCTEGCKTAAGNHVACVHRLINYIDIKAKCRLLKKMTCEGTWRQVFIRVHRLEILSVMLVFSTQL